MAVRKLSPKAPKNNMNPSNRIAEQAENQTVPEKARNKEQF
ncbi:hypothetical protein AB434_0959 [Heyndrickxia coagulans]|jgi:hypothetical protein|uniref:Uncharacterized protein n=1 Tax=Heyndrickxia coagulans TaxID=1398 RepID=A0AAN0T301_HEYCO|nr:hypothetical protein SB48_HM08orf00302 [Heyndrickxia coagulans]AKN53364.1 hypothetical protein AB434_0959 [Heyndrickxia coagulans]KYC62517.1 hypothetical protein B4100_1568 [Heyndrickxia coagulans]KYC86404.1 hypothetical protein B4096_1513 [Heyndrickxia coagulans]